MNSEVDGGERALVIARTGEDGAVGIARWRSAFGVVEGGVLLQDARGLAVDPPSRS